MVAERFTGHYRGRRRRYAIFILTVWIYHTPLVKEYPAYISLFLRACFLLCIEFVDNSPAIKKNVYIC